MEDTRDRALLQHTARQDAIRFEMIVKELKCAREWQQNWGFLNDLYPPQDKRQPVALPVLCWLLLQLLLPL
ncbi:hypothetical protein ACSSS7_000469 [Eimeria intestinalis]